MKALRMPTLSPTMTHGKLVIWFIKEGESFKSGDSLFDVETDKATLALDATYNGKLGKILVQSGDDDIPVNKLVGVALEEGDNPKDIDAFIKKHDSDSEKQSASEDKPKEDKPKKEDKSDNEPAKDGKEVAPAPPAKEVGKQEDNNQPQGWSFGDSSDSAGSSASSISEGSTVYLDKVPQDPIVDEAEGLEKIPLTMREALRDAMKEEMHRDKDVLLIGEEVAEYQGAYKVSQGLLEEFSDKRVKDTPITEHGFAGIGVGMAFYGLKPIVEFMSMNFSMQAIDHVVNSAAKTLYMSGGQIRCPIVFRGPNGAAAQVAAQHSQCYGSWYAHIPGLKVISPSNPQDAKGLLKAAIRDPNPIVFLENEILYSMKGEVPVSNDFLVPIGKAKRVREGSDITAVSFSIYVNKTLEAASALEEDGISVEVIDLRTLNPLDMDTVISSIQKTNRCVVVEEGWKSYGVGSEISARIMEDALDWLDAPVRRVAGLDIPLPYAKNLEKMALPQIEDIIRVIKEVAKE